MKLVSSFNGLSVRRCIDFRGTEDNGCNLIKKYGWATIYITGRLFYFILSSHPFALITVNKNINIEEHRFQWLNKNKTYSQIKTKSKNRLQKNKLNKATRFKLIKESKQIKITFISISSYDAIQWWNWEFTENMYQQGSASYEYRKYLKENHSR